MMVVGWTDVFFLVLALIVWPVVFIALCHRLGADRHRPQTEYLAYIILFGVVGSWLLSSGLLFMPMLASLCFVFSVVFTLLGLVLAAILLSVSSRPTRESSQIVRSTRSDVDPY